MVTCHAAFSAAHQHNFGPSQVVCFLGSGVVHSRATVLPVTGISSRKTSSSNGAMCIPQLSFHRPVLCPPFHSLLVRSVLRAVSHHSGKCMGNCTWPDWSWDGRMVAVDPSLYSNGPDPIVLIFVGHFHESYNVHESTIAIYRKKVNIHEIRSTVTCCRPLRGPYHHPSTSPAAPHSQQSLGHCSRVTRCQDH